MTEEEQKKRDENALKRIATFVKTYSDIVDSGKFDKNKFTINASFASNAVNHYLDDLDALKKRYKISDLVQMPKIAGLMANAILRYRPIVPINGKETNIGDIDINEYVAIYQDLLCVPERGKQAKIK